MAEVKSYFYGNFVSEANQRIHKPSRVKSFPDWWTKAGQVCMSSWTHFTTSLGAHNPNLAKCVLPYMTNNDLIRSHVLWMSWLVQNWDSIGPLNDSRVNFPKISMMSLKLFMNWVPGWPHLIRTYSSTIPSCGPLFCFDDTSFWNNDSHLVMVLFRIIILNCVMCILWLWFKIH